MSNHYDPYILLIDKLNDQLPAIRAKLTPEQWDSFREMVELMGHNLEAAKNDDERAAVVEEIRNLSHFPSDYFLVGEIQIGVLAGTPFETLKVDGGASTNNLLMQLQADLLNTTVIRPQTTETTALGAAFLAGLATGYWTSTEELKALWQEDRVFSPQKNEQTEQVIKNWEARMAKI